MFWQGMTVSIVNNRVGGEGNKNTDGHDLDV